MNFDNNLMVIPVFKKIFGSFGYPISHFPNVSLFASGAKNALDPTVTWLINAA
jgi:type II secretory pathway component PulF